MQNFKLETISPSEDQIFQKLIQIFEQMVPKYFILQFKVDLKDLMHRSEKNMQTKHWLQVTAFEWRDQCMHSWNLQFWSSLKILLLIRCLRIVVEEMSNLVRYCCRSRWPRSAAKRVCSNFRENWWPSFTLWLLPTWCLIRALLKLDQLRPKDEGPKTNQGKVQRLWNQHHNSCQRE